MNQNSYKEFPNFVLRSPILPLNFFLDLTSGIEVTDKRLKKAFESPIIQEAVFLASPSLFEEAIKWLNGDFESSKIKFALLKYLARMSFRCTPFGLFAGCSVGQISNITRIQIGKPFEHERHTRLDMNYLVALAKDLSKQTIIREHLLFYKNSSAYTIADELRYVEYQYFNNKRLHQIVSVECTDYLLRIIEKAKNGCSLNDLRKELEIENVDSEEINEFIDELIDSQVLISELEPSVSGPEFLDQIILVLKKINIPETNALLTFLNNINDKILLLDQKIGNDISKYYDISEFLKEHSTDFDLKYLYQTDLKLNLNQNTLDSSVIESVKKGVALLNNITPLPEETNLANFANRFKEKYDQREISLAIALDTELGIGYSRNQDNGDVSPLVDDLILPKRNVSDTEFSLTPFQKLLQKKILQAYRNNDSNIILKNEDIKSFKQDLNTLSTTVSALIQIVYLNGKKKIRLQGVGGSSAANIIARFAHGDSNLKNHTQSIIDFETEANANFILAEIIHLPESRVGNILMRPAFRKFEIPYLTKSFLDKGQQLTIEDLTISISSSNKIVLKSKKHNKIVIPRLTNAHNFYTNSLPIYHFLSDLQTQGNKSGISISVGPLANEYEYIPRIEYDNLILQEATWNLSKVELQPLIDSFENETTLQSKMSSFRQKRKIPKLVIFKDGDNELLINLNNLTMIKLFLNLAKNRKHIKITEFLFEDNHIVTSENDVFTHQIVLSFYNSKTVH